jgi:hypothetical protein
MTNRRYPKAKQFMLQNTGTNPIGWDSDLDARVILVKSTYTYADSDEFVADIIVATNDNGRTAALTSLTSTNGIADAADISLTATDADACNALIIFKHTGADATARLIAYLDTVTGLPFTPAASGAVNILWDSGANKIFAE